MDNKENTEIKERAVISDRREMDQSEIIKKSLTLLGFLLLFCIVSIPCYFLMTAGAKDVTNEVTVEKSIKDAPRTDTESRNIFGGGDQNQSADQNDGLDNGLGTDTDGFGTDDFGTGSVDGLDGGAVTGDVFGTGTVDGLDGGTGTDDGFGTDDFGTGTDDGFGDTTGTDIYGMGDGFGMAPDTATGGEITPEQLARMKFRLHGLAFFGGMFLAILLYIIYFEFVLKKKFHELMQGDRTALVASLVAFFLFILTQFIAVTIIPNRITKGLSTFSGIPWELAYAIPVIFVFFTLIATWVDTNCNKTLYFDDVAFHYVQFGKGAKNLILIPGLSTVTLEGKGINMAWQFREFAKDYTVYVMDKRDDLKEDVTLRELAEDIKDAVDHIGLLSADVVGVSQGGMIAQYFTIDNPDFVGKLVLAVTASKLNDHIKNYVNQCVILAQKGEMEEIMRDSFENDFTEEYTKPLKPFMSLITKMSVPKSNVRFIRLARSINSLDTYDELDQIKCPVFVIGAGKDRIATVEGTDEIAGKLECKKYIYQRYGHGVYSEAKDFNERIHRFLMTGK